MAVTQEGAVVGRVGLSRQPQEQRLREAQCQGELAPQLPHTVQQQQEDRGLLLETGMGVGRVGTALLEWVSCLEKRKRIQINVQNFLCCFILFTFWTQHYVVLLLKGAHAGEQLEHYFYQ